MEWQKLNNNNIVNPFPPYIFKFHYDFEWERIKDKVYKTFETVPNVSELERGDSHSTLFDQGTPPHKWPELAEYFQWLHGPLSQVWNSMNYNWYAKQTNYQNSWFNIHRNSGETLEHQHAYTELVITSYLQLPKDSGYIEFRDPLEYHKAHTPIRHEEELWKEVPCATGDILIFPGWLKHRVQPNKTDLDRIVMTVNVA